MGLLLAFGVGFEACPLLAQPLTKPTSGEATACYVVTLANRDSLEGDVIYNYRLSQITVRREGSLRSYNTDHLHSFGIYDVSKNRLRRFVRADGHGVEPRNSRVCFLEEFILSDSVRLLRRLPFIYIRQGGSALQQRRLADYVPERPNHLSHVERRLYRRAKHDALHYQDAQPIYYLAGRDTVIALTQTRRWLFWQVSRHNAEPMLAMLGPREPWARRWIARHGDPFNRQRHMEEFIALCQAPLVQPEI